MMLGDVIAISLASTSRDGIYSYAKGIESRCSLFFLDQSNSTIQAKKNCHASHRERPAKDDMAHT